jgi:hypothetical protein
MKEFIENTGGFRVHKWDHYFELYEKYFSKYRNKSPRILEIGVFDGGSLQMWKNYFGEGTLIVGCDIDRRCLQYAGDNVHIFIADQNNKNDIDTLISIYKNFDIIIDDGSHINSHVVNCFNWLFPILNENGTYFIEDTHTAYSSYYGGGFRQDGTSVEYSKKLIDHLTSYFFENEETNDKYYTNNISGIHFHDSIIVFEKKKRKHTPFDVFYVDGKKSDESAIASKKYIE